MVFAGAGKAEVHLPGVLRGRGAEVRAWDTALGGASHDMLRREVQLEVLRMVREGGLDVVFIATPCKSYSPRHVPRLRGRIGFEPLGLADVSAEWQEYIARHNELARFTGELIRACHAAGVPWLLENPADVGDEGGPAWWPRKRKCCPIWLVPYIADAIRESGGRKVDFAQCAFGAKVRKWTTIAYAEGAEAWLAPFMGKGCVHGFDAHEEQASGRDEDGVSRSEKAAAYPPDMCEALATALLGAAWDLAGREELGGECEGREVHGVWVEGGRIAHGSGLHDSLRAHVQRACATPAGFGSQRNLVGEDGEAARERALPPGLQIPAAVHKPRAKKRRLDFAAAREAVDALCDELGIEPPDEDATASMPEGHIGISQLFGERVYAEVVGRWMRRADAAGDALSRRCRGEAVEVPRVPTWVVGARWQPGWARGRVWDCSDPARCVPVRRSTRHTRFPGRRQLDRDALRTAAAELEWSDADIIEQACGGGLEPRSECELETVLAFHHAGLLEEAPEADTVVRKHIEEEWVSGATRDLPYVPCRLQPRDVVQQERARIVPGKYKADGSPEVEYYLKPRITTNSSYGGDDSVNAGVPQHEREVELPRVQWLAAALAICDEAGRAAVGRAARAVPYCVDAESAYSFCPVQHADLWTQCFVWWGDSGGAEMRVDRRLGFGGAFAPNRFERVSTLVGAYVRLLQQRFDALQPPPDGARVWSARRRAAGEAGVTGLAAPTQQTPAYLQVYVDDYTGCALDDDVREPADVAHIHISAEPTEAVGGAGSFARRGTRVHVHAQLAVLGLARLGLHAAPEKVVVGDPIVALGFEISAKANTLKCPEQKRAVLLDTIARHMREASGSSDTADDCFVDQWTARRSVGRLSNLAQVFPEVREYLHAGYRLIQPVGGAWQLRSRMHIARRGEPRRDWLELMRAARGLLQANEGVPLLPRADFPAPHERGTLLVSSDASGDDGVGGYVFDEDEEGPFVWLVSAEWPPDVLEARRRDGQERARRRPGPVLPMPAAELFGAWGVLEAVAEARGKGGGDRRVDAVIAVMDCEPAVGALNAACSGKREMAALLRAARGGAVRQWLGAATPREANRDADRLSHPSRLAEVRRSVRRAGLRGRSAEVPGRCWAALRAAIARPEAVGTAGAGGGAGPPH